MEVEWPHHEYNLLVEWRGKSSKRSKPGVRLSLASGTNGMAALPMKIAVHT